MDLIWPGIIKKTLSMQMTTEMALRSNGLYSLVSWDDKRSIQVTVLIYGGLSLSIVCSLFNLCMFIQAFTGLFNLSPLFKLLRPFKFCVYSIFYTHSSYYVHSSFLRLSRIWGMCGPPRPYKKLQNRAFDTRVPDRLLFRSYLKTWPFPSYLKIRNIYPSGNYLCNFIISC